MSPAKTYNHRSDNDLHTSVKLSSKVRIMISFQKYAYDSAIFVEVLYFTLKVQTEDRYYMCVYIKSFKTFIDRQNLTPKKVQRGKMSQETFLPSAVALEVFTQSSTQSMWCILPGNTSIYKACMAGTRTHMQLMCCQAPATTERTERTSRPISDPPCLHAHTVTRDLITYVARIKIQFSQKWQPFGVRPYLSDQSSNYRHFNSFWLFT